VEDVMAHKPDHQFYVNRFVQAVLAVLAEGDVNKFTCLRYRISKGGRMAVFFPLSHDFMRFLHMSFLTLQDGVKTLAHELSNYFSVELEPTIGKDNSDEWGTLVFTTKLAED
jgi:hypothetical protein